jgi:hypothetical protein
MTEKRITSNGALCDRCDTNRTTYQIYWTSEKCFVCPACMTPEERAMFKPKQETTNDLQ